MKNLLIILSATLLFTACNKYKGLTKELETTYNHDNKSIEVEGYIHVGLVSMGNLFEVTSGGTDTRYGAVGDVILKGVKLATEGNKNSIVMKDRQTRDEVELFDNNGNKFTLNDKVKIKGIVKYTNKDKDFDYTLTDVTIEK